MNHFEDKIGFPYRTFHLHTNEFQGFSKTVNLNTLQELSIGSILTYIQNELYHKLISLGLLHMAESCKKLKLTLNMTIDDVINTPSDTPIWVHERHCNNQSIHQ